MKVWVVGIQENYGTVWHPEFGGLYDSITNVIDEYDLEYKEPDEFGDFIFREKERTVYANREEVIGS